MKTKTGLAPERTQAGPAAPPLQEYASLIGAPEIEELRVLAQRLSDKTVKMINSSRTGGGVAEILTRIVPLLREMGVETHWEVIQGDEQFFQATKAFHNAIHGRPFENRPEYFETFLRVSEENRRRIQFDEDFIVIHDPQPLGLVPPREQRSGCWIWRCHIDSSHPNREVWNFLLPFVERCHASLFSSSAFTHGLSIPQYLFYPSIDPLSDKNRPLDDQFVRGILQKFGIDPKRPILTQVSRFDKLKDPVGVITAYRKVRKYMDCQLVLAGGSAEDDPEGQAVLAEVREAAGNEPDIHVLNLPPNSNLEINALQRGSTIVVQKSLREGFALTVSEALLKRRPVVASAVGGIPLQVIHKVTGMLSHSIDGTAYQIRYLLSNPKFARRLGDNGYEHVRQNFLLTHSLRRFLILFLSLLHAPHQVAATADPPHLQPAAKPPAVVAP